MGIFNYLFFTGFIKIHKTEFHALSLNDLNVETLTVPAADLYKNKNGIEWHENNSEVSVNGNYFEVISIIKNGADVIVKLAADGKESNLMSSFFTSQKKHNDILFNLVKLFFNLNLNASPVQSPINMDVPISSVMLPFSKASYDYNFYSKLIKPPQIQA